MDISLNLSEPCESMQQMHIITIIRSGMPVNLILVARRGEESQEVGYYVYCEFKTKTVILATQKGEHRFYSSLDRAMAWAQRLGFQKVFCIIDFIELNEESNLLIGEIYS